MHLFFQISAATCTFGLRWMDLFSHFRERLDFGRNGLDRHCDVTCGPLNNELPVQYVPSRT
jgi:hypothetical protein